MSNAISKPDNDPSSPEAKKLSCFQKLGIYLLCYCAGFPIFILFTILTPLIPSQYLFSLFFLLVKFSSCVLTPMWTANIIISFVNKKRGFNNAKDKLSRERSLKYALWSVFINATFYIAAGSAPNGDIFARVMISSYLLSLAVSTFIAKQISK